MAEFSTYAAVREAPYYIVRGLAQRLEVPIRHGSTGALVAPDAASTMTITDTSGTAIVDAQTVTVTASVAGYTLTPAATLALGSGAEVRLDPVYGGVSYPAIREEAFISEWVPPNRISAVQLYGGKGLPELKYRVPQHQGPNGDAVGWQPQIDAAYWDFLSKVKTSGRKAWLIRDGEYREWCLAHALLNCCRTVQHGPDDAWAKTLRDAQERALAADGDLQLNFSDDAASTRRSLSPTTQLAPSGRYWW
jgi:hypothetical protein